MAASLLGTFAAAEGAGAPTTGSRTTTSGSLICVHGSANSGASDEVFTFSDSFGNTITKALQHVISTTLFYYQALGYNIGGTRGAAHTMSANDNGGNAIGGTEWSGVATSPTVVTNTGTGTSTTPSISVTVSAASLMIGQCGYKGTATTISVSDGTEAIEIDENNDRAADNVGYKVGQTGSPSIGWTLAASREWITIGVGFTEASTGRTTKNTRSAPLGVNVGMNWRGTG